MNKDVNQFHEIFVRRLDERIGSYTYQILRKYFVKLTHHMHLSYSVEITGISITQILREIKGSDSKSAKSAILTLLKTRFYSYLHF